MANWFCGLSKHTAVAQWAATTAYSVGDLRRQLAAPTAGNERVFRCTTAGTSGGSEPSWTLTQGGTTNDGSVVWTEVTGNSAYGWNAAHYRIQNAIAWMAAGDTLYVSHIHSYTSASGSHTYGGSGTQAAPLRILCVDDSADPPTALATGASEQTSTGAVQISFTGFTYWYGITIFGAGSPSPQLQWISASRWGMIFDSCILRMGTYGGNRMRVGNASDQQDDQRLELINTPIRFGHVSQNIQVGCPFVWRNSTAIHASGSVPTTLMSMVNGVNNQSVSWFEGYGLDLSAAGSGKTIISITGSNAGQAYFQDCKLGASVALISAVPTTSFGGVSVTFVNCDSSDTNYRYYFANYGGEVFSETTITRDGTLATDGTTAVMWRVATSANVSFYYPFTSRWLLNAKGYASTGSKTLTHSIYSFGANKLTNAEVWIECQYLGTSGCPISSLATDRVADGIFATPADQATDTGETWTGTARANSTAYSLNDIRLVQGKLFICTTAGTSAGSEPGGYATANDGDSVTDGSAVFRAGWRQELSVTVTTAELGPIYTRLCVAKAGTTIYFDRVAVVP